LKLAGIREIEAATRFIGTVYRPGHNARFARPPEVHESGFVTADPVQQREVLRIEEERVLARDNTVAWDGLRLQLPPSPWRHHFVKANVKVRQYPDGSLAIFHGPRCIARYTAEGRALNQQREAFSRAA